MTRQTAILVGCGGISNTWLRTAAIQKKVDIVGLVDIDISAAEKAADRYGLSAAVIGEDLPTVLDRTSPAVLFDCTLPSAHCGVTITALRHGCHVLGEKPMSDSLADARKMVKVARQTGRTYAVIQNRRFQKEIRALRRFIDSGAIGRVTTVQSNFFIGADFGREDFRQTMKHVLLEDMAIHTFDAARLITGANARTVYAHEWNPTGSWYDRDASAVAIFEMTDDILYTYQGSWCSIGNSTTWECDWRIIGEKGSIRWDGAEGFKVEVKQSFKGFMPELKSLQVPQRIPKNLTGSHSGVIGHFLDCVEKGETPETHCEDNIRSLKMVYGAIDSIEKKTKVRIR